MPIVRPSPEIPSRVEPRGKRTEGIAARPLKRLRTQLSIPLGLRHASATRIKRSLWWRANTFVPKNHHVNTTRSSSVCRPVGPAIPPAGRPSIRVASHSTKSRLSVVGGWVVSNRLPAAGGLDDLDGGERVERTLLHDQTVKVRYSFGCSAYRLTIFVCV